MLLYVTCLVSIGLLDKNILEEVFKIWLDHYIIRISILNFLYCHGSTLIFFSIYG